MVRKGGTPWNKGKKCPWIKHDKQFKKGNIPWNKGLKYHTRVKRPDVGERMKGNKFGNRFKKGYTPWNKGRKLSKEHIRNSLKRRTPSSLEQKMIDIIQKLNFPYKFVGDGKFFIENKNPDFINCNGEKITIEVFWGRQKNLFGNLEDWKEEIQIIFNKYGWKIIFLNETQVNEDFIINKLRW